MISAQQHGCTTGRLLRALMTSPGRHRLGDTVCLGKDALLALLTAEGFRSKHQSTPRFYRIIPLYYVS